MKKLILLCLPIFLGCSGPKDATKENFTIALKNYLSEQQGCFEVFGHFPQSFSESEPGYRQRVLQFDSLVSAGLLDVKESSYQTKSLTKKCLGKRSAAECVRVEEKQKREYTLTKEGLRFAEKLPVKKFFGETQFCYSGYKLTNVVNFSEPAEVFGKKITEVVYEYKASDIEEWGYNKDLINDIKQLRDDIGSLDKPLKGKAVLILSGNGWVHESQFN